MRIHFIVRTLNEKTGGGSHHNALAYIRFLQQAGHDVTVHSFAKGDTVAPGDIPVRIHNYGVKGFTVANDELVALLKTNEEDADVFFLYGVDFLWGGGKYRKQKGGVPVAVYLDNYLPSMNLGSSDTENLLYRSLYRAKRILWEKFTGAKYKKFVDRYIAVSPFLQDVYVAAGFPAQHFVVLPNAFTFPVSDKVIKESHEEIKLLYAGRLIYDKGIDLLIAALSKCAELTWKLTIVGSGPMLRECQELVRYHKLENRITFVPWVDSTELGKLYDEADIFVHPARWPEPFGRTLIEAMSHSLALIVPRVGAAVWVAGESASVFENGNQLSLESAIQKLLVDPVYRRQLAAQGPSRAEEFTVAKIGPLLTKNLEDLIS